MIHLLKRSFRAFAIMLQYSRIPTIVAIAGMLFEALEAPLAIYCTGRLVDTVAAFIGGAEPIADSIKWGALLVCALLLNAAAAALRNMSSVYCLRALNRNFTHIVLNKFRRVEYACFEDKDVLDSIERMGTEPQQRIYSLFSKTGSAVGTLVSLIGAAIVMAQISAAFAVVFLLLLAPMLWLDYKWEEEIQRLWNTEMPNWRRRTYLSSLMADKNAMFELKLFGAVDYVLVRWKFFADSFRNDYIHTKVSSCKYGLLRDLSLAIWAVCVILSLLSRFNNGTVSLGAFTVCFTSMGTILALSQTLSRMFSLVSQDCLIMQHFDIFMNLPEIPIDDESNVLDKTSISSAKVTSSISNILSESGSSGGNDTQFESDVSAKIRYTKRRSAGVVRFENVSFSYPKTDKHVLCGVTFKLHAGEHIALVGENGAGKSTIVKLLCGLYEPTGGGIFIDDVPLEDLTAAERRRVFSPVFQDYVNYELTLRENVAFGDISKLHDDAKLLDALQRGLWIEHRSIETDSTFDLILSSKSDSGKSLGEDSGGGYGRDSDKDTDRGSDRYSDSSTDLSLDTNLGKIEDDGVDLSGGQWQRIAVSRALVSDAAFILLDEPTAALDPLAESRMYDTFRAALNDRGCIMISHRLASARLADNIIVLDGGIAVQCGTHDELMSAEGLYRNMYEAQADWYTQGNGTELSGGEESA